MTPTTVHFTGFETNAERARKSHPCGQVSYWPLDWLIVPEKTEDGFLSAHNYPKWIRENCLGIVDFERDPTSGARVFAFENAEDAILFKMTF